MNCGTAPLKRGKLMKICKSKRLHGMFMVVVCWLMVGLIRSIRVWWTCVCNASWTHASWSPSKPQIIHIEDSASLSGWLHQRDQEAMWHSVLYMLWLITPSTKANPRLLFWNSCTAHTIDLMLEDIEKLPKYKTVIERARSLAIFLYSHHRTLILMCKYTHKRDLASLDVTRFAIIFLRLRCLVDKISLVCHNIIKRMKKSSIVKYCQRQSCGSNSLFTSLIKKRSTVGKELQSSF